MNNVVIAGNETIPPNTPFWVQCRGKTLYDGINWTQSGMMMWDAVNQVIYIQPTTMEMNEPKITSKKKMDLGLNKL